MPDWKNVIRERLRPLDMTAAAEADLTEELAQHLEDEYREKCSAGLSPEDSYRRTVADLENLYPVKRIQRMAKHDFVPAGDAKAGSFVADLGRDLRYAARSMRRSPGFVLVVVLTLALGIGANTTVFTVINTLILNPLQVADPSGLAAVALTEVQKTSKSNAPLPLSYADLKDYQDRNQVFASMAGYTSPRLVTWQEGSSSQRLFAELVTGTYFSTLGLHPARGRFFSPEEDGTPGTHPVAVLNYGAWETHFGGDPNILGRTLRLNHIAFTVIGVAPPKFIGVNGIFGPDFWIPAAMTEQLLPTEFPNALTDRLKAAFQGVGRLNPGISRAQAQANLATIASDLAREFPDADEGRTTQVLPIRDALFTSSTGSSSPILYGSAVLFLVVGVVLLIACSNVANLLLARSAGRQQEIAVRLAMGASRARLVKQLLTESVVLGLAGGAMGLFVGYAGLKLLFGMLPGSSNFIAPKLDATVLLFGLAISLITGLLFGSIPAFQASRADVADSLKEEARTTGASRRKIGLANVLLVAQVAFSFLLLVLAGLFLRSIGRAYSMDPGFQTEHLAIFMTNPGQAGYGKAQTRSFYKDVTERVSRMPGVESESWASNLPLWSRSVEGLQVEGRQQRSRAENIRTILTTVDVHYFETAGVAIEKGRDFTKADQDTSTPVAVIIEKLAHDYWPGADALGRRILLPGEKQMRQIVGIARVANYSNWAELPQNCVYVPLEQKFSDAMTLYVRSKGDPHQVLVPVEREILAAGPQIIVSRRTGRELVDGGLFQAKTGVALMTVFGLLALGLASIGLYGILAYSVNRRKREIGLRMALGAAQGSVLRLVLKQGMMLVLAGVAVGFGAALIAARLLSGMLFGVGATDPVSVAGAALVLLAVALLACYLPARRASRVDPLVALREG